MAEAICAATESYRAGSQIGKRESEVMTNDFPAKVTR